MENHKQKLTTPMRAIAAISIIMVGGYWNLIISFSDYPSSWSALTWYLYLLTWHALSAFLVGFLIPSAWYLAILTGWGSFLFPVIWSLYSAFTIGSGSMGPGLLRPNLVLPLASVLVAGYAGARFSIWRKEMGPITKIYMPIIMTGVIIVLVATVEFTSLGKFDRDVIAAEKALEATENNLGPNHPDVAVSLIKLAALYGRYRRYPEAEQVYQRALTISENAFGSDHPLVASSLSGLASLYHMQGRYAKAEPLYQRGLAIYEKALGQEHRFVGLSIYNLAKLYQDQGQYAKAEPLYKRSMAISEKSLGPDNFNTVRILNNLAVMYQLTNREKEAEIIKQQLDRIRSVE